MRHLGARGSRTDSLNQVKLFPHYPRQFRREKGRTMHVKVTVKIVYDDATVSGERDIRRALEFAVNYLADKYNR